MRFLLALGIGLLWMLSGIASRADVVLSVGPGKGILGDPGTPFERAVALGYEYRLPKGLFVRAEGGYFLDISGHGKSSFWAAPIFGVRAQSQVGPVLHVGVGPGWLQSPDGILGGHFQFSVEGGIGLCDENVCVQAVWKHLSSAGFNMPNHGRDFICAQAAFLYF